MASLPAQIVRLAGVAPRVKSGVPHSLKRKAPTRNRQPAPLVVGTYSLTIQKVQSSVGSTVVEV